MMKLNNLNSFIPIFIIIILFSSTISSLSLEVIDYPNLIPGEEGKIRVELKNLLNEKVENVNLNLDFKDLPFIPLGSSEQSIDEINDDDEEVFIFTIKASTDSIPGDYEIPYKISYTLDNDEKTNVGTIGIKIVSQPDLFFSISADNPIINKKGKLSLKIINKGLYDARFVSIKALPVGLTILSDQDVYIGTVDSDDFETATFDVIFTKKNPRLDVLVEYKNFDNDLVTKTIFLPVEVYSSDQAIKLGLLKKSYISLYILIAVSLIILLILWRILKKRRRLSKSMKTKE
mgnify:FL=1